MSVGVEDPPQLTAEQVAALRVMRRLSDGSDSVPVLMVVPSRAALVLYVPGMWQAVQFWRMPGNSTSRKSFAVPPNP